MKQTDYISRVFAASGDKAVSTVKRIINSAEILFVEHGIEATSLRMITRHAKVNLAAVNYHFGSKENLIGAIFDRGFVPFLEHYRLLLNELKKRPVESISIEQLSYTLIKPVINMVEQPDDQGTRFVRLASSMMFESRYPMSKEIATEAKNVVDDLLDLLSTIYPQHDRASLQWRIHFSLTLIFHAFAGNDVVKIFTQGDGDAMRNPRMLARQLMPFIVSGLSAPTAFN